MSRTSIALGDALAALFDYRGKTPKKLGGDWSSSGHRVVSALNIKGNRVDDNDHHYVSSELYAKWMKEPLRAGDVLLTSEAPTGEVAYLTRDVDWVLGQRLFALRGLPGLLDGRFLYYSLRGGDVRHQLIARSTGTTVSGIRQSELVKVILDLPPVVEQRAIAEVLGALDDKIEANRRVIDRAEHLARACAESSPDKVALGDVASVERNTRAPAMFAREEVDHYSIPAFDSMGLPIREIGGNIKSGKYEVTGTMVLVSKLNPHIPRVWYASTETGTLAIASTEFICVRPSDGVSPEELWACCSSSQFTTEFQERVTGTTGSHQRVRPEDAMAVSIPDPRSLSDATRSTISDTVVLASAVRREITRLADLRDTLLPKLLSGELRVREAEELVGEAV